MKHRSASSDSSLIPTPIVTTVVLFTPVFRLMMVPIPGELHVYAPKIPSVRLPQGHNVVFRSTDERLARGATGRTIPCCWSHDSQRALYTECEKLLYNEQRVPGQSSFLSSVHSIRPSFCLSLSLLNCVHHHSRYFNSRTYNHFISNLNNSITSTDHTTNKSTQHKQQL